MTDQKDSKGYSFTYHSVSKQKIRSEVEQIRLQYMDENVNIDKMEQLRALDKKVKVPALIIFYFLVVLGILIIGSGLSLWLVKDFLFFGLIDIAFGFIVLFLAYPINQKILKSRKQKYSSRIIKLCDDVLES